MLVHLFVRYMESFDSLGEFMDLDLLDHLGDAMLLSDKLMFLGKWLRPAIALTFDLELSV